MLPWWRQFAKKRAGEDAALRARLELVEKWLLTGTLDTPGVVWMPPITIQ